MSHQLYTSYNTAACGGFKVEKDVSVAKMVVLRKNYILSAYTDVRKDKDLKIN